MVYTDDTTGQEGLLRFDLRDMPASECEPLTTEVRRALIASGITWLACDMSRQICEVCGGPGKYLDKRVRCAAHVSVSTQDVATEATKDVHALIARAMNPGAQAIMTAVPTKKRPTRT
ncbi:hypothetical protein [Burkholderia ubonensis]|uniref:hypothetical protein n=1 Tax=Burkholderia ubonensis TaxID=101571 RepID=UPI0011605E68|nr:hypothetical protein [Burkholderia ubonensis]